MIDATEVRLLADDLGDAGPLVLRRTIRIVRDTASDVVSHARALCPVDTGELKASISADIEFAGLGFEAGPTADHGAFVEYGTPPHEIRPRIKRALWWPGALHPVGRVHHPGTSPQPYMIPAFEGQMPEFEEKLADAAEDIL